MKNSIYGVNFGGWLVLEKWIKPELFIGTDAEDDYHLTRTLPQDEYRERITQHRRSFIREEDFAFLAGCGINTIRIPIPFYIFGDRNPYLGCLDYLDFAFDMAEKYGQKILIDLHTAPGSQNGFDNGGICGVCKWAGMPTEVEFVLSLLEKLAIRYGQREGLWGIQPLNEPITDAVTGDKPWEECWIRNSYPPKSAEEEEGSAPIRLDFLKEFYQNAYDRVMPHMADGKYFVIHDAFRPQLWKDFMREDKFRNIVLDNHFYLNNLEIAGCPRATEAYEHMITQRFVPILNEIAERFPIIIGEWSLDNGCAKDSSDQKEREKTYQAVANIQQSAWEHTKGAFLWTYRILSDDAEKVDAWSFEKARKWLKPLTD